MHKRIKVLEHPNTTVEWSQNHNGMGKAGVDKVLYNSVPGRIYEHYAL